MTTAQDILRYTRDVVLDSERAWTKGVLHQADPQTGELTRHCLMGALEVAGIHLVDLTNASIEQARPVFDAQNALETQVEHMPDCALFTCGVIGFNDRPSTTYADVISLLDYSIKRLDDPPPEDSDEAA